MRNDQRKELIDYLKGFIKVERWETIDRVIANKTKHLTIVLEDIHKPHNANAVLRSCEGFGIKDVHIIENRTNFDTAYPVSMGAHKWLDLYRYKDYADNIETCFNHLKNEGYQVIATTPHEKDQTLNQLDITKKTALVFGTEKFGISDRVKELADGFVKIPMYGFSESFNISVSAAICLYDLTTRIKKDGINWELSEEGREALTLDWLTRSIKAGNELVEKFKKEKG